MDHMDIDAVDSRLPSTLSYTSNSYTYQNVSQAFHPEATTPNIYQPLPTHAPRIIRLLAINLPLPTPNDPLLKATLEIHPLDSAPPYDALSYVWGSADDVQPKPAILCNNTLFPVTANLHWALHRATLFASSASSPPPTSKMTKDPGLLYRTNNAGDPSPTTKPKIYLWADAISINQSSLAERSSQVSFMSAIYARARRVLVCMGDPPTPGAERAVGSLINTLAPRIASGPGSSNMLGLAGVFNWEASWRGLAELMRRPWFGRVWVMQEVGMARGKQPVVLYGREAGCEFGYRDLMAVVGWAKMQRELVIGYGIAGLRVHGEWLNWGDGGDGVVMAAGGGRKTFFDLLDHSCLLSCRDPRDRIYAFLGHPLARGRDGRAIVQPDYSKGVNELYLEVARICIGLVGLRALVPLEHTEESLRDGFPSWMTRWHITGVWNNISRLPDQVFCAGGLDEPGYRPAVDGLCLMLEGFVVDRILTCFPIYRFTDNDHRTRFGPVENTGPEGDLRWFLGFLGSESTPSMYGRDRMSRERAFSMTICAAMPGANAVYYLGGLLRLLDADRFLRAHPLNRLTPSDPDAVDALTFWKDMSAVCTGRAFAVTEGGRYCLVPLVSRPGDQVCVIRRLDVPVVMRADGPRRALLGEAYVLGLMEGEAIQMAERGELENQIFAVN